MKNVQNPQKWSIQLLCFLAGSFKRNYFFLNILRDKPSYTKTRGQFHQRSTSSFYVRRSQMRKNKTVKSAVLFGTFWIYEHKSCTKILVKLTPVADPIKLRARSLMTNNFSVFYCEARSFYYQWFFSIFYKHSSLTGNIRKQRKKCYRIGYKFWVNQNFVLPTWTLDSVRPILMANSSLMKMSG